MLVLLAGADRPPPPGFLALAAVLIALVIAGSFVIPIWWDRGMRLGAWRAALVAAVQGAAVGTLVAGLFTLAAPDQPGVQPDWTDALAGISIAAIAGALLGIILFAIAWALRSHDSRRPGD